MDWRGMNAPSVRRVHRPSRERCCMGGMECARQPVWEMKELTLEMDVDTSSAVLLMEHTVEASAWTS